MLSRDRPKGFGLLEAIVALTLLAGAGVALFGWINGNLATASRLRSQEQLQVQRQIATAWLQTVDPWNVPGGEAEVMPGWRLSWRVVPQSDLTAIPPWTSSRSAWESRLVELQATLTADGLTQQFSISRLAVRRTVPFGGVPNVPSGAGAAAPS